MEAGFLFVLPFVACDRWRFSLRHMYLVKLFSSSTPSIACLTMAPTGIIRGGHGETPGKQTQSSRELLVQDNIQSWRID